MHPRRLLGDEVGAQTTGGGPILSTCHGSLSRLTAASTASQEAISTAVSVPGLLYRGTVLVEVPYPLAAAPGPGSQALHQFSHSCEAHHEAATGPRSCGPSCLNCRGPACT